MSVSAYTYSPKDDDIWYTDNRGRKLRDMLAPVMDVAVGDPIANVVLVFRNGVLQAPKYDYTARRITPKGTQVIHFQRPVGRTELITLVVSNG